MTAQADPYVRVYYRIVEDERFVGIYPDDRALATWLRLLIIADGAFPAPAHLPRSVNAEVLDKLVRAGVVDLVGADHFRIHGLEAERARRSEVGRRAAAMRWQSGSNADALREHPASNANPMHSAPLRSSPIQSEPIRPAPATAERPTIVKDMTTKKKPADEEEVDRLLDAFQRQLRDGLTASVQVTRERLMDFGIHDPAAEISRRAA